MDSSKIANLIKSLFGWAGKLQARRGALKEKALQIALELESYAIACVNSVQDADNYESSAGNAGAPLATVPEPPAARHGLGRLGLSHEIMDRMAQLHSFQQEAQRRAVQWWDLANNDVAMSFEISAGTIEMAALSLDIASLIREKHGLLPRTISYAQHESLRSFLSVRVKEIESHRARDNKGNEIEDP